QLRLDLLRDDPEAVTHEGDDGALVDLWMVIDRRAGKYGQHAEGTQCVRAQEGEVASTSLVRADHTLSTTTSTTASVTRVGVQAAAPLRAWVGGPQMIRDV
ncbi:MAG TPA: hypothetical protein VGD43_05590, partial [Micromonospora sp.]